MKKGPFKLKSGNKPSMAQLSGVSPVKLSQFQKDVQATRARNKAKLKAKREEAKTSGKPKEPSKIKKDIKNVFSRVDKAIQGFFNNPRSTAAGGDDKTYLAPDKGIASKSQTPTPTPPPATPPAKPKVTYRQAWNKMSSKAKSEYGLGETGFKKFKTAAIEYNKGKKK